MSAFTKLANLMTNGVSGFNGGNVTNGYAPASQLVGFNINWAAGGAPAAGTTGNNTSTVAGTLYWVQLINDSNCTITGIDVLTGTTGGTDKWIAALYYYSGSGTTASLVANSALAGTTAGTANNHTTLPLTSTYTLIGPGIYFVALQSNGTTATFQSYNVANSPFITGSQTGTFGTLPASLTFGSSYNNNKGPICCTY